jgi:hypothetical protein
MVLDRIRRKMKREDDDVHMLHLIKESSHLDFFNLAKQGPAGLTGRNQ